MQDFLGGRDSIQAEVALTTHSTADILAGAAQEFLDGRALLTPQQRGRLQDFLADAGPGQLESVQESVNWKALNPPPSFRLSDAHC